MRFLGIDPGLQFTGYGCVDLLPGHPDPVLVEGGVFRLNRRDTLASRLADLERDLEAVINELAPDRLVVEQIFSHVHRARTAILMGHARGVILLSGGRRDLPIDEYPATEVKKAITGRGHARKQQVQASVASQLGLREIPDPPDVADAIALALCAARRREHEPVVST
ncbi:MAG: crossover junction endodeoxyribonuclease RuvC [Phycisphaerales bacterium]|nr:crossover junction endodeoxyribonuclease RuvC [Phycisphaerales bacterium]